MSIPFQFKARSYLHFDGPIAKDAAEDLVTSPASVARHSFYPFLGFTIEIPKVEKLADGTVVKKDPKLRAIKIAAHADAAIYAHYARALEAPYEVMLAEAGIADCVTAFRKFPESGRNNVWFANEAFEFIQANRPCVALALDVEKFFDRLDHKVLKASWKRVLGVERMPGDHFAVFKSLTRFSWVERKDAYGAMGISENNPRPQHLNRFRICKPDEFRSRLRGKGHVRFNPEASRHRGIPQGSPVSALLSNIYMFEFDKAMHAVACACGGLYRRYCDDIMLIVQPEHADAAENVALSFIRLLKLNINSEKTNRVKFPKGPVNPALNDEKLQYLGFIFDGRKKLIRDGALSRYYNKMRRAVRLVKKTQLKHNRQETKGGRPLSSLRKRKLFSKYSYLVKRHGPERKPGDTKPFGNFLTYAYKASRRMNAPEIKRQVRNHWSKLQEEIKKPL